VSRILLTGGGGAGTQALWAQWPQHELYFADADPDAFPDVVSAHRRVVVPMAANPAFADSVKAACQRLAIDVLVPGVDEELAVLARFHGAEGWPRILLPGADFVETMLDKLKSMRALAAAGLDAPATVELAETDALQGFSYPLILKPRSGRGSRGVMVIHSPEQIPAYLALHRLPPEQVVAQALAVGQEYTVFAFADEVARLRAVVPVKVLQKRGITIRACTEDNQLVVDYVQALQDRLRPTGPYNLQCILTPEGRVVPFEINPRISTTFCLVVAAGADPLALALAGHPTRSDLYRADRKWSLRRNWNNHITVDGGDVAQ
jgi:carbamoyl-phosphate synthase large subunit